MYQTFRRHLGKLKLAKRKQRLFKRSGNSQKKSVSDVATILERFTLYGDKTAKEIIRINNLVKKMFDYKLIHII